jgi:hypothetical protein
LGEGKCRNYHPPSICQQPFRISSTESQYLNPKQYQIIKIKKFKTVCAKFAVIGIWNLGFVACLGLGISSTKSQYLNPKQYQI